MRERYFKSATILNMMAGSIIALLFVASRIDNAGAQTKVEVPGMDQPISINGKPAVQGDSKPSSGRRGGDGGTVTIWRPDHTMLVYPGEEGKENGQSGKGPDLTSPGMLIKMTAAKDGIVMHVSGYVAKVRWQDIDKLKNLTPQ